MNFREESIERLIELLVAGRKPVLVSPTGSGKTRMGTQVLKRTQLRFPKAVWTVHRGEMCQDAVRELQELGFKVQFLHNSKVPLDMSCDIFVSTIQSLLLRKQLPVVGLVVWDECHHGPADSWRVLPELFPGALVMGLTATPERRDGRPLGDLFDEMHVAAKTPELIAQGYLVQPYVYRPRHPLDRALAIPAVDAVRFYSNGDPTFVYANRVTSAYNIQQELSRVGIQSYVIEGKTDPSLRKKWFQEFRNGKARVLVSVDALTEGVDAPQAACAVIARKVASMAMMIQICGRVLRPYPGKDHARIVDLTGSTYRCGLPDSDYDFSLQGRGISLPPGPGPKPDDVDEDETSDRAPSLAALEVIGEPLIPVGDAPPVAYKPEEPKTESRWMKFLREGQAAGFKRARIAAQYFRKFGEWPPLPNEDNLADA